MNVELDHTVSPKVSNIIGGRSHVSRRERNGVQVVDKARRPSRDRDLFLEASLQMCAARRFVSWSSSPLDLPIACTSTVLTTSFYGGASSAEGFFHEVPVLDAMGERLGEALAWLHTTEPNRVAELPLASIETPPLLPISFSMVAEQPSATLSLAAWLQAESIPELLHDPEVDEQPDVFVHGDLKFDNVLMVEQNTRIKIIDWECAGRGIAAIDLGAFSASLLYEALRLGAIDADKSVQEGMARTNTETAKAWRTISGFITTYRAAGGAAVSERQIIRLCARSLLARATSYTDLIGTLDRLPKTLVRVALQMLKNPANFEGRFQ